MAVFNQGLTGLRADQKAIEVTSNNVANANTVGFKKSRAEFADMYAGMLYHVGPQAGTGAQVQDVAQQFTQGAITPTGGSLDLAIQGNGFFKVKDPTGKEFYTRNGAFSTDSNGYVVSSAGDRLQSYKIDPTTGKADTTLQDLKISEDVLPPSASTDASIRFNLDAREDAAPASTFDAANPSSYNSSTSMVVYDDLGRQHSLKVYMKRLNLADENAVKNPGTPLAAGVDGSKPSNTWSVYGLLDGVQVQVSQQTASGYSTAQDAAQIVFGADGKLQAPDLSKLQFDLSNYANSKDKFSATNKLDVDFKSSTQYGAGFVVQDLAQNGYESANFSGFDIDNAGLLSYQYTNGQRVPAGMISVYKFNNPNGLQPVGDNKWEATHKAGNELSFLSGESAFASVKQGFLEESNVDLTEELVNLISFQRSYQANSQSIKTEDALIQTATSIRNG